MSGTPAFYPDYFSINSRTGVVSQTRVLDRETADTFEIVVQVLCFNILF